MKTDAKRIVTHPDDEAAWHSLRDAAVTSTMSPALFGMSPYTTEFELWISKHDNVRLPFKMNDRIGKGSRLQDGCADEVALSLGGRAFRIDEFISIKGERMGSSFDYRIEVPGQGMGILEVKCVDPFIFRDQWDEDEAPTHIEIQLQHQLECADVYDWGMIAAFTSIFDFKIIRRDRDREMGAAIRERVAKFWADVEAGNRPTPDFAADNAILKKLHRGGPTYDATEDVDANAMLARYVRTKAEYQAAEQDFKSAEGALFDRFRDTGEVFGRDFKAKLTQVKGSAGREITQDQIGTIVGARSGYTKLTITDLHKKGRAA